MSDEQPPGGQPIGQLSPDGRWRWDGHNWVPAQQQPQPAQPYAAQPYATQQFPGQPYGGQQYGGFPPGTVPPKKGVPTWAKVLIILLSLFVALIVLLTVVGLTVDETYGEWSCEDVAKEAVRISDEKGDTLVLTEVSDLEIVEDHREDFSTPDTGQEVILSCEGTGSFEDVDETLPITVELSGDSEGDEWVSYEMTE
jgi:hypothetical protein